MNILLVFIIIVNVWICEGIVKTVHVINSCHLDIGFADSSAGIVNRYFDSHFPSAIRVDAELRRNENYTDTKLNFMFQSWMIDLYLDCPVGMGLHCPNETQVQDFEDAIRNNVVSWHAFPHNAQLEIMGKTMIALGLNSTFRLDDRFGKPRKRTLSQRDVPGMTRSLIPILKAANVSAISIGANDGSTPPNVPPCFKWVDSNSGESILALFTWPGYGEIPSDGSIHEKQMQCVVEGLDHALVYNWNGDNAGPFSSDTYVEKWNQIQKAFPGADVVASTFDNFTQHLLGDPDVFAKLPVVKEEIGDSWIYGVPSDPQKVQRMRVMNREWTKFLKHNSMTPELQNATRFFLKAGEHTWGRDVKSNLFDNDDWLNKDFEKARAVDSNVSSQFMILEESWWEQRLWGISTALDTLEGASHPLAKIIRDEFDNVKPVIPNTQGLQIGHIDTMYTCGNVTLSFDSSGALSYIMSTTTASSNVWASKNKPLFELKYRSYSADDVSDFFSQYCKSSASWVAHDYGKPGLPSSVVGEIFTPTVSNIFVDTEKCIFVLESSFDNISTLEYGAPSTVWTNVSIIDNSVVNVEMSMFNKTTTRIPEAMFVQFQTPNKNITWSANKLGSWIEPDDIVDGGTKHLHGITEEGLRVRDNNNNNTMQISSLDAAVANFGMLTAYPSPVHETADTSKDGSSFVLWDNLWGTNYIMWWPFIVPPPAPYSNAGIDFPIEGNSDIKYRFSLSFL